MRTDFWIEEKDADVLTVSTFKATTLSLFSLFSAKNSASQRVEAVSLGWWPYACSVRHFTCLYGERFYDSDRQGGMWQQVMSIRERGEGR